MGRTMEYEDIFRLRDASDPRLSPDGRAVAFVVTMADEEADENRSSVWTVAAGGGAAPAPLTRGDHDAHPRWSPDGRHLAFLRADDDKVPQIWLLPAAGGEARKLTSLRGGVRGFEWSPDSTRFAVLSPVDLDGEPADDTDKERRKHAPMVVRSATVKADGAGLLGGRRVHLFVVDARSGEAEAITKNDINVVTPRWSPDGKRIAFAASLADRDRTARTHLFVADAGGGEADEVVRWGGTAVAPFFSPDSSALCFVGHTHPGPGHARLYRVAGDFGEPDELAPGFDRNVMIGGPAYPGAPPRFVDGDGIVFCARDRGCTNAYLLRDGSVTKIAGDGATVVSGLSDAGGRMVYVKSAPDIPGDVFIADAGGGGERRLTDLNRELLDGVQLHEWQERTFTAADGLQLHGWVLVGDGPAPQPLLVDIHGGPHNAWNSTFDAVHIYHEVLASQGWSILRLNPRGSDGYGETFFTGVVGAWGEIDQQDFEAAVDALVVEGVADPERLAVCGYSYGGHMTNWLTARTDRFKAAMSGGCLSNYTSFYGNSDIGFWMGLFEFGAEPWDARDRFVRLSPISYVENVKTPTLLLHGENDDRCPIGQAEEWFVSLRRRGVETELVRYPGASHLFILNGRPSHRIDYNRRIEEWMTSHT
jgi:dipeptidyl aminopeptidase/acylaminoacyl peptidase